MSDFERADVRPIRDALANAKPVLASLVGLFGSGPVAQAARELLVAYDDLRKVYDAAGPGPVETFALDHPPRLDMLDGIYDCGKPGCSGVDSRHHDAWERTGATSRRP